MHPSPVSAALTVNSTEAPSTAVGAMAVDVALIGAVALLSAVFATCSSYSQYPHADSLLFTIISVQHPTLYYWGQNRVGNLLPILLSPIHDVYANYYAQTFLRALSATLTPLLTLALIRPRGSPSFYYAAALVGIFLIEPGSLLIYWVDGQPYFVSAALVLSAVAVLRMRLLHWFVRGVAGFLLLTIATWVHVGIIVITAPILVLLLVFDRRLEHTVLLGLSLAAYLLVRWHASAYGYPFQYESFSISMPQMIMAASAIEGVLNLAPLGALLAGTLIAYMIPWKQDRAIIRAVLLMLGCLISVLFVANLDWFRINGFNPRYFCLPILLFIAAASVSSATLVARWSKHGVSLVISVLAVALAFQATAPSTDHQMVTEEATMIAAKANELGAGYIGGDYWLVWPAVFETMHQRNSTRVFGITDRGWGAGPLIRDSVRAPQPHIMLCFEETIEGCKNRYLYSGGPTVNGKPLAESFHGVKTKVVTREAWIVYMD
jgi:hypothetical protein